MNQEYGILVFLVIITLGTAFTIQDQMPVATPAQLKFDNYTAPGATP